jgi:ABC-type sugar transport system substrate-binding protein
MKSRLLLGVALLGVAAVPISVKAEDPARKPFTVQQVYQDCKDPGNQLLCVGVISGVTSMMRLIASLSNRAETAEDRQLMLGLAACGDWTDTTAVQAFKNWAEKHPEHSDLDGRFGVMVAMTETWPCN